MEIIWKDKKRTLFGLPLSFTKYELAKDKLMITTGFLSLKEDEVKLYRILDVTLKRSFIQRVFKVGTIHCCSSDKSLGEFDIINIKNPKEVKEKISSMVEEDRMSKNIYAREYLEAER